MSLQPGGRSLLLSCSLLLLGAAGCGRSQASAQPPADTRPRVTVAQPLQATVADFSEHTGRAEAPADRGDPRPGHGSPGAGGLPRGRAGEEGGPPLRGRSPPLPGRRRAGPGRAGQRPRRPRPWPGGMRPGTSSSSSPRSSPSETGTPSAPRWISCRRGSRSAAGGALQRRAGSRVRLRPLAHLRPHRPHAGDGGQPGRAGAAHAAGHGGLGRSALRLRRRRRGARPAAPRRPPPGSPRSDFPARTATLTGRRSTSSTTGSRPPPAPSSSGRWSPIPTACSPTGCSPASGSPMAPPRPALLISDRAVGTDQDHRFVWVVGADGKASTARTSSSGPWRMGCASSAEAWPPGDRVVVRGLQRVRPGAELATEQVSMRAVDGTAPPGETGR